MHGQSAKVNSLRKRTVYEIIEVKNMPKVRPLSHDRSLSLFKDCPFSDFF